MRASFLSCCSHSQLKTKSSPSQLRRDYNLVWGDASPVLLPITRAASKDGRRTPTKTKGRKRKRTATQDDDLSCPTIPSNLEWAVVFMR